MKLRFTKAAPLALAFLALVTSAARPAHADPRSIMGSGNFNTDWSSGFDDQFQVLNANNVTMCRINAYPAEYWNGSAAVTNANVDAAVLKAKSYNIRPVILINYYANYWTNLGIKFGGYDKWRAVGAAYAARYRPNSPWLQSQGISNWGIEIYEAFNEPELDDNNGWINGQLGPFLPINTSDPNSAADKFGGNYYDAMRGFADGVKSVQSSLKVINGGFFSQNAYRSYTCRGYASAIAPLFNNGSLDGLNLHTYNDAQYAPLVDFRGTAEAPSNESSAFNQFRRVKQASGITADIDFYSDEFNYKFSDVQGDPGDDDRTAKYLFTQIWTTLGVTKNNGASATKLAFLWSLFPAEWNYTTNYGNLMPYNPRPAAKVYKFVADQTAGMEFSMLDPFGACKWEMTGNGKKAWIWINAQGYTNVLGQSWTLSGIPSGTSQVRLYGWDGFNGPRQTYNLTAGQTSLTIPISVLPQKESFFAVTVPGVAPTPTPVVGGNISSNLVARYKADDASGTTLTESTANNHANLLGGTSFSPSSGRLNGCVNLSSSGYAAMSSGFTRQFGNTITYACWFKTSSSGGLVGENNTNVWQAPSSYSPILYVDTTGKLRGGFYNGSVNNLVSGATVNNGQWHHAALSSTGSVQKLYLNGVLQGTWNGNVNRGEPQQSQWGSAHTNGWPSGPGGWSYFNGSLDDMRIYQRALSDADVALLSSLGGGTASASSAPIAGEGAAQAFDGKTNTKWLGNWSAGSWLSFQIGNGAAFAATQYSLTSANDEPTRDPKSWKLQGWNGASWVDLNTQTNQSFSARFQTKTYTFSNSTAYTQYRLLFQENGGANLIQLAEFNFLPS